MYYGVQIGPHRYLHKDGEGDNLRFLCHPSQLPLAELWIIRGTVEICSLNQLPSLNIPKPDELFDTLMKVSAPADRGGWRDLMAPELSALYLGHLGLQSLPDFVRSLDSSNSQLLKHPAVKSGLGFAFSNAVPISAAVLLASIYDIRRFIGANGTRSTGLLKSYYRVARPDALQEFFKTKEVNRESLRPSMAFLGWYSHPFQTLSPEQVEALPSAFLFREAREKRVEYEKSGSSAEDANYLSLWRATARFLSFVKLVWEEGVGIRKFDAERFFKRPVDVEAFQSYIKKPDTDLTNFGDLGSIIPSVGEIT